MKKITKILAAVTTALVLSFTGCVNSNADLDTMIDLSPFYLRGNMNGWANAALSDGALTAKGDGTYTIAFTAGSSDDQFAIADSGWSVKYCDGKNVALNAGYTELTSGGDNAVATGLTAGTTYTMTIQPGSTSVFVKIDGEALVNADVSTLTSTTAVKTGAYVKIEGASYASMSGIKVYFDGKTTASAYFEITATEKNDWSMDHLGAWFKFYAGDGVDVMINSAQFYSKSTTLGTAVAISNTKDGGYDNFECSDMVGAVGVYKLTIATTTDGATMTLAKIN